MGPFIALAAWTAGLVTVAHHVGLWESDVLSDTIVWFVTVGMAFLFSLQSVGEDGFFRRTARRAVGVTVFVEVFVNLAVLPLPLELVLVPLVTFVAVMAAFTEGKDEYRPAHALANVLLSIIGVAFIVYVTVRLAGDFDADQTARKLALPVWLTLGVMPLIYAAGLLSAYERAFLRINFSTDDPSRRRQSKRALLRAANIRAPDAAAFGGQWINDLTSAETPEAAREVMHRYRAS